MITVCSSSLFISYHKLLTWVTVKTFDDYQNFLPKNHIKQGHLQDPFMPVKDVREKLDQIKGHLVWMPLEFLKDAEMAEKGLQINAYTESIYT
jgi:phospholipase D1/2